MTASATIDDPLADDDHVQWVDELYAYCPPEWHVAPGEEAGHLARRRTPGTGWPDETKGGDR